jgi:hypothetical protein
MVLAEGFLQSAAVMKTPYAIGMVAASVLITVAIEESRIASLRPGIKREEKSAAAAKTPATAANGAAGENTPPVRTKNRPEMKPAPLGKAAETDEESFAKTARKMWDNPAGKSMMNQGVKMAVAMMYQDFIDGLDLTKEEADYFKNLLGKEMAGQQEIGMKMLGATEEERKTLAEEITKRGKDNEEEIKKFLNSEEDYKKYNDYKNHLPERQQLDGIRSAMSGKGVPLDAETETRLVDAMYRARTEAKAPGMSGPAGMDQLAKGNIVETYEKSWAIQQEALRAETSKILNEAQMAAFQEYQKQAKEMQLMGLKMAEKMMQGHKEVTR